MGISRILIQVRVVLRASTEDPAALTSDLAALRLCEQHLADKVRGKTTIGLVRETYRDIVKEKVHGVGAASWSKQLS